ncbi:MAG: hypothetical protein IPM71_16260 [Bacteroidota bacterium]|nr:MAG: hypothetical protein IPM71_16260 [Bacteroidota bacterium]
MIAIFIVGFISFGIFVIYKSFLTSIDFMGIITGTTLLWIGLGYLTLIVGRIKTIELRDKILIIKKPFLNKRYEIELTKIKYLDFEWEMTWNTMKGILIKINNKIEQISIKEYSNSKDFIDLIKTNCEKDNSLKPAIWTKELKLFLLIGLIILFGLIVFKIIK